MATIHIIHGYIAFGKTTLAKKLARELPAVHLDADEWIARLYGMNLAGDEFMQRANTVIGFQWDLTQRIIDAGADVILDLGPWSRDMRRQIYDYARQITPNIIFHTIMLDMNTARQRLAERTAAGQSHDVTSLEFFDSNMQLYEPITDDEGYQVKRYYQE